jgi:hypothetical protein
MYQMKKIYILVLLMLSSVTAFSQVEIEKGEKASIMDRIYFGGGFSATFGTIISVYVSPTVGYMITRSFSAGIGVTYQYYKDKRYIPTYESNSYGGRLYVRQNVYVIPKLPLFAYGEYENLNIEAAHYNPVTEEYYLDRQWYPRLMLGAGLFAPFGRRGGFYFAVLYDVIYKGYNNSPYNSPWVYRIGFSF